MGSMNRRLWDAIHGKAKIVYSFGAGGELKPQDGVWGAEIVTFESETWDHLIFHQNGEIFVENYFGNALTVLIRERKRKLAKRCRSKEEKP